jgi:NAD(P)-dependent dehydrogenase (short-subunit alcohol dehydrogenase family)
VQSLDGKVAVVTGAASGFGFAMAKRFAGEGASVVLADVAEPQLSAAVRELVDQGADAVGVPTDVTQPEQVDSLADFAFDRFNEVHLLCNNAGLVVVGPTWEIDLADWHRLIDVNLWGVIHGIHSFVPRLVAQTAPSHVVNTASMAGVITLGSLAPYVVSKHAVVSLSEVLQHDLDAVGAPVTVSVVLPGAVPTRLGYDDRDAAVAEVAPGGVSADDVAERVREAIADERFFVFTHEGSIDLVQRRHEAIVDGRQSPARDLSEFG